MHRGRGGNQSHCNGRDARESVKKPLDVDEESRGHGRNKPEKLIWKSSRSKCNNSVVTSNLVAGKHKRILVIRKQSPNVVSQEEARLDPGVANNVIDFLSSLQQVPRGLGRKGIQNVLAEPDVQGRARAVLSSLHDECKKKLQRNDSVGGKIESDFGSSFSCRISRGPTLSHPLEWPGRHKQLQNQISAEFFSHAPHLAVHSVNGSSFPLQQVETSGEPWLWGARSDIQQRQPNGWWRKTLLGSLAGAAGISMMSFKFTWLFLPELFSLPWFRRNRRQKPKDIILKGRNWWHLPVKVATAISSRFCGSLSNSVVAANLLLLIFDLRSMIDSDRSADSDLKMLKDRIQEGRRCCSCLTSCNQGGTCVELYSHSRNCETCCVNSCGEFDHVFMDDKLPLNWREDIVHLLALLRKGREAKDSSAAVTSKDDIGHLAELIHAVLSMPKHSLDKLLHAELPAPAPAIEVKTHLSEEKGLIYFKTEEVHVGNQKQDSEERSQDAVPQKHLKHSTSVENLICPSSLERNLMISRAASASSLQCLGLGSLQNLAGETSDIIIGGPLPSQKDAAGEKVAEICMPDDLSGGKFDWKNSCGHDDSQVSISFVSKDFPEGIELVFPQHTPIKENKSCLAAATTDPHNQSAQAASTTFVEGHPDACKNSDLLRSILLEKLKTGLHSSKSSVYASDVDSEYFFETSSMSLPDLEHSGYQQTHELDVKSENLEEWKITHSDALRIHEDDHALAQETTPTQCEQNSFNSDCLDDQVVEIQRGGESLQSLNRVDTGLKCRPCPLSMTAECVEEMTLSASTSASLHFADHPTCISLRERRHEYVDQNYLTPDVLNTARWRELVFWHGHCRQGNPTLCILLGKAVKKLPARELQTISSVIISQMEYAELNFFKGSAKQMNIIMDMWGIGLMRMPPLEILSRVGMIMNRDYAGRGGSIFLVNAPMMLSLVIGAIKRVILRPGYNKGAMIEKGFLENKDRILFFNRNYKHALEEHFELTSLPPMLGGKCNNKFCPDDCDVGCHTRYLSI